MKTHEKDDLLLCKFQTDTLHIEKLNQQNHENYVLSTIIRIEQKTLIPQIQASQCELNTTKSRQEQMNAHLENNKKFQEQSYSNNNDLSSKFHILKNKTQKSKSSTISKILPLLDDNLTCTSQTSSVISVQKQKMSIQTKKKIKKQNTNNLGVTKQTVSRKQTNKKCKFQRGGEKSISPLKTIQNDQKEIVQVSLIESIIEKEAFSSDQSQWLQNQYYIHNLIGYLTGSLKNSFMAQMYMTHFSQLFDNLKKSKLIECPQKYALSQKIQSQKRLQKSLIIDLDETLVHCNEYSCLKSDFFIPMIANEKTYQVGISVRPYAQQFLQNMAKEYEIIIFTASNPDYANKIIDYLDPQHNLVSYRLFRDDCIQISNNCHIKDLRILNRNIKDIVLVDNSAYSFAFQVDNGIPIIPYLDDKNDKELLHLQHYLINILQYDDVRIQNNKNFNLKIVQNCNSITEALKQLVTSIRK